MGPPPGPKRAPPEPPPGRGRAPPGRCRGPTGPGRGPYGEGTELQRDGKGLPRGGTGLRRADARATRGRAGAPRRRPGCRERAAGGPSLWAAAGRARPLCASPTRRTGRARARPTGRSRREHADVRSRRGRPRRHGRLHRLRYRVGGDRRGPRHAAALGGTGSRSHATRLPPARRRTGVARPKGGFRGGRPPGSDEPPYRKRTATERSVNRVECSRAVANRDDGRGCVLARGPTAAASVVRLRTRCAGTGPQSTRTSVFWQACSSQVPSSCLVMT